MSDLPMNIKVSVRLFFGDGKCFGPGPAELLKAIDSYGSLRSAAAAMSMSYSKAWKMLRSCENELGFLLLKREVGGKNGGFSQLTQRGRCFLEQYDILESKLCKYGNDVVGELFNETLNTEEG
ncbi:MAG: LysR family transcriptional regulator [Hydrogenoanaerobacterium sp.]